MYSEEEEEEEEDRASKQKNDCNFRIDRKQGSPLLVRVHRYFSLTLPPSLPSYIFPSLSPSPCIRSASLFPPTPIYLLYPHPSHVTATTTYIPPTTFPHCAVYTSSLPQKVYWCIVMQIKRCGSCYVISLLLVILLK